METNLRVQLLRERYRKYIHEHINNVKTAWKNMNSDKGFKNIANECIQIMQSQGYIGSNIDFVFVNLVNAVNFQVESHDLSKFSDEEFEPYRKNFYPLDDKEKEDNAQDFEKAWEHHYTNNSHHWNWWAKNDINSMPLTFVIEMCCDWIAMSMKFPKQNALEWYKDQKNIKLGKKQKECMIKILTWYYSVYKTDGSKIESR